MTMLDWLVAIVGVPTQQSWDSVERYYCYGAIVLTILIAIVIFKLFISIVRNILK